MSSQHGQEVRCPFCKKTTTIFQDKYTDVAYCEFCLFPIRANAPIPLNDSIIHRYIEQCNSRIIILFWAPWHPLCNEFLPLFSMVYDYAKDSCILATLDISQNPDSKRHFSITIIPTIIVFEYGRETNRILDPISRFELERLIDGGSI